MPTRQAGPYLKLLLPSMRGIDLHAAAIDAGRRHDGDAAAAIEEDIRRAAVRLATLIPPAQSSQPIKIATSHRRFHRPPTRQFR